TDRGRESELAGGGEGRNAARQGLSRDGRRCVGGSRAIVGILRQRGSTRGGAEFIVKWAIVHRLCPNNDLLEGIRELIWGVLTARFCFRIGRFGNGTVRVVDSLGDPNRLIAGRGIPPGLRRCRGKGE